MADLSDSVSPSPAHARPLPVREDCWSEDATGTLIDTWGRRYLELNRGNLRQKDWQDVADAVNALHGHTRKTHRTDVQCKNRIDTIKKKYKVEKARVSASNGVLASSWAFYDRLNSLIGSSYLQKKPSPSMPSSPPVAVPLAWKMPSAAAVASAIVAVPQKRSVPTVDGSFLRRNYSVMAAAAAAAEAEEDEEDEDEEDRRSEDEEGEGEGMMRLARAIERFGVVYERVEAEKLKQMVELEKQRMQFTKDLEVQRTQMFLDTQLELERIKRGKKSASNVLKAISVFSTQTSIVSHMGGKF